MRVRAAEGMDTLCHGSAPHNPVDQQHPDHPTGCRYAGRGHKPKDVLCARLNELKHVSPFGQQAASGRSEHGAGRTVHSVRASRLSRKVAAGPWIGPGLPRGTPNRVLSLAPAFFMALHHHGTGHDVWA
jgi:hypothetical protein